MSCKTYLMIGYIQNLSLQVLVNYGFRNKIPLQNWTYSYLYSLQPFHRNLYAQMLQDIFMFNIIHAKNNKMYCCIENWNCLHPLKYFAITKYFYLFCNKSFRYNINLHHDTLCYRKQFKLYSFFMFDEMPTYFQI